MKSNARPGDAMAKLEDVIQVQSPRIDNGELGASLRNRGYKPSLRSQVTDLGKALRMSPQSRYSASEQRQKRECGKRQQNVAHGCVLLESPQADNVKEVTVILAGTEAGDSEAADQLPVIVDDELRRLIASKLSRKSPSQTFQPTALGLEDCLCLVTKRN